MCISYKCLLDKPQVTGSDPTSKSRYQISEDCTYWPVLGSFNNWNTVKFTNKKQQTRNFMQCIKLYYMVSVTTCLHLFRMEIWCDKYCISKMWSIPRCHLRYHSLVCIENPLFIVGIVPILNKEL